MIEGGIDFQERGSVIGWGIVERGVNNVDKVSPI